MAFDERHDVRVTAGLAMAKGSAVWLPSPIPRPENLGIRAEYRGGNWPNTRNPAGGADGVWVGSVGGDAAKAREWTAGIGGDVLSTSRLTISRASSRKVQGRRYALPDSIPRGAGEGTSGLALSHGGTLCSFRG
jgi:hypothetical protein